MSNTATVSPYDECSSGSRSLEAVADSAASMVAGTAAGAAAVKWIYGNTEEQKAAFQEAREEDGNFSSAERCG